MSRVWPMFASVEKERKTSRGNVLYLNISPYRQVLQMSGFADSRIIPIDVVEDPTGEYLGWIDTGAEKVDMVQLENIFPIQFAYGVDAAVTAGDGNVVRLTVVPRVVESH